MMDFPNENVTVVQQYAINLYVFRPFFSTSLKNKDLEGANDGLNTVLTDC